ncbi:Transmembrane protein [Orchesella cincta]|uniref:Transmembrane protein n=1 Tax=Orchesella cincta TaxID=48709 RepID=A0A1D2NGF6_ORCCI|nr:Transmembrane protein [Orchesella cincta]
MTNGFTGFDITSIISFSQSDQLKTFSDMWYRVFLWAFLSSIIVHVIGALIAFGTLRKHRVGRFFPLLVLLMGIVNPGTTGLITSAVIAFIYKASILQMTPFYAFVYGVGQTGVAAAFSFTRILATL